jgi:hypothetical protein
MPISFASHNWFVVNKKGDISRWEVAHKKWSDETRWGYLYKNLHSPIGPTPDSGVEIIYGVPKWHWDSKLLKYSEGDENSLAERMVDFIENSKNVYKHREIYHFMGPNSNTYAQWVLNNFPEFGIKLPKNAVGKNFN